MIRSLLLICLLAAINAASAQDGVLDNSFGSNGTAVFPLFDEDSRILSLVKHEEKLYGAGFSRPDGPQVFTVVRFTLDGSLDTAFAGDGILTVPLGTGFSNANKIMVQPDGKLIAAGWARFGNKEQYVLVRFVQDGSLDDTFGTDGVSTGSWSGSTFAEDEILDAAFFSDGRIVVCGKSYNGLNNDVALASFMSDGSVDTVFGDNGVVIYEFDEGIGFEVSDAIAITTNDEVFIGGTVSLDFSVEDGFFLLKFDDQGTLDMTFGEDGKVIHTIADDVVAGLNDIAFDSQGRIVTGGGAFDTDALDNEFFLTRYSSIGVIDNTFGDNGTVILNGNGNESISELAILDGDKILAAGSTGGFASRLMLVRLEADGSPDESFGTNGKVTTLIESTFNGIESIAVDESCVYGGGFAYDAVTYKMALAKYTNQTSGILQLRVLDARWEVYPNPLSGEFHVRFATERPLEAQVILLDTRGSMITRLLDRQELAAGDYLWSFDLPDHVVPGEYFLTVRTDQGIASRAVLVH